MLAGMIFRKEPFFAGADNVDQLYKIAKARRIRFGQRCMPSLIALSVRPPIGVRNGPPQRLSRCIRLGARVGSGATLGVSLAQTCKSDKPVESTLTGTLP